VSLQELFDLWCLYSALQLVPREKQRHAYLAAVKQRYKHLPEISRIDRYVGGPFEFSFLLCFVSLTLKLFTMVLQTSTLAETHIQG
jgi:hypothetical protein